LCLLALPPKLSLLFPQRTIPKTFHTQQPSCSAIKSSCTAIMHGRALLLCKSKSRGTNRPIRTLVYENWIINNNNIQCLDLSNIVQFWYMMASVVCGSNWSSSVLGRLLSRIWKYWKCSHDIICLWTSEFLSEECSLILVLRQRSVFPMYDNWQPGQLNL
jgi:hypothetical protein